MSKLRILTLILVSLSLALPARSATHEDHRELPQKAASQFVEPLLQTINSGDRVRIESFVRESLAPSLRDRFSMETDVGILEEVHARNGELSFHSSRDYEEKLPDKRMVAILYSERLDRWIGMTIDTDSTQGDLISGLSFSPVPSPARQLVLTKLTEEQAIEELAVYVAKMSQRDVFSGTVLLARGEKILFQTARGLASKRFGVPNDLETKFNLGSMNKMFTSVAILQLVQGGRLKLTDKLSQFADESWLPREITEKVEIRHLLTHSSGLGSYFNRTYVESSRNLFRALDDYKPLIRDEELIFEPGTDNAYSDTGMFLLGVVIEKVTGRDYFEHMRTAVYARADMEQTDCYEMDRPIPNLAIGYEPDSRKETGWRNNLFKHVLKGGPAEGGFSTVGDLHRFALALMANRLLDEHHTEEMLAAKPDLHSPRYGFGFGIGGAPGDRIVGHGGDSDGISSHLAIYLDRGYVAAILSNYGNGALPIKTKIHELLSRVE